MEEEYLSDGVYASFDGYQVRLRTRREDGEHIIYLEPRLFDDLMNFAIRVGLNGKGEA